MLLVTGDDDDEKDWRLICDDIDTASVILFSAIGKEMYTMILKLEILKK